MGSDTVSLSWMKQRASDHLAHILSACLNIFEFYIKDELEISSQSSFTLTQEYVITQMNQLDWLFYDKAEQAWNALKNNLDTFWKFWGEGVKSHVCYTFLFKMKASLKDMRQKTSQV